MGIKERRTKILLSLFLLSDLDFKPLIFTENLQNVLDLSFNKKTKASLSSLLKEKMIEKGEVENEYKLTDAGFNELCLKFPFFRFLKTDWDGKWRIISYEIPESKREIRDRLRREMQGWGLGPWHRSFWLTPHPVLERLKELVVGKEEEKYIQAFSADHSFGENKSMIEKVWMIKELDKRYREMFKKWHDILAKDGDKVDKFLLVISEYVSILRDDPGLPKQLVGEQWIGFEANNIFKEIRSILLS